MQEIKFSDPEIQLGDDGLRLTMKIPQSEAWKARRFVLGSQKDTPYVATLKLFRPGRSLDANAYCWTLLTALSEAMNEEKERLYLRYVKECGPYKDFTLSIDEAKTFRVAWEKLGTGWPTEQVDFAPDGDRVIIRAYYGSSTYNTKQMSRLIDLIVEDCRSVGVETLTPDKLALLKEDWNAQRNKSNVHSGGGKKSGI